MAIIIEEGRNKLNLFTWTVIVAVIILIVIAIYYLFLSPVPLIEKVIPDRLQSIKSISADGFNPDTIINNPTFKILRQYINPIQLPSSTIGRANPFLPIR